MQMSVPSVQVADTVHGGVLLVNARSVPQTRSPVPGADGYDLLIALLNPESSAQAAIVWPMACRIGWTDNEGMSPLALVFLVC